jgi:hypothetical protein
VIYDCVVVKSLTEMPIDSEGDFMESDVAMDDSDEDNGLEEGMEGLIVCS